MGEPSVSTQREDGRWVPAIPLPFLGLRKTCDCGRRFWTLEGYQGHYALVHLLGGKPSRRAVAK